MARTLIAGGTVVTAADAVVADVLVEGERIAAVGLDLARLVGPVDRTVDAAGLYVLPGGIDPHVHLESPQGGTVTSDDFETGTVAAAHGGTTTIVDFAVQDPEAGLAATLDRWHGKAAGKAAVDYGFHMILREASPATLDDLDGLVREGVASLKLFMAYPGQFLLDDQAIARVLDRTASTGQLTMIHAENGLAIEHLIRRALAAGQTAPKYHEATRPATAEAEATARAIAIATMMGAPAYVVHLSCAAALEAVREARSAGKPVYAETCPHYLVLTKERYDLPGFEAARYTMTPPLREKADQDALWRGLAADELSVVSTDHCPFCMVGQKDLGRDNFNRIPNGAPGIETRLGLLHDRGVRTGRLTWPRLVEISATAPARLFGLYPKKGTIAPGSDADLVLFDPKKEADLSQKALHMRVDYSLYEGWRVTGAPVAVFLRGMPIVENGRFVGRPGGGAFVARKAGTPA